MEQAPDTKDTHARHHQPHAAVGDLPLRADAPPEDRVPPPPGKDIHKTFGGKLTHFLIYGLIGFVANSAASVGITYFAMPKEWVKKPKDVMAKSMSGIFKGTESERMRTANSTLEILIMFLSGTLMTAGMIPLAKNRGKIAHAINKVVGRDADVLPDEMKPIPVPRTLEDKVQQEVDKRVNTHHSSSDLWKARFTALAAPFFGDMALSNWNNGREKVGKESADTFIWKAGGKFYDKMVTRSESAKNWVDKTSDFFEKHGAGVGDIEKRAPEKYPMLLKTLGEEAGSVNKSRAMIAEQARMLTKEVGWTIIAAALMERLVLLFNKRRVQREQQKAAAEVTAEGFVPEGYKVAFDKAGYVELQPTTTKWADKAPAKPKLAKAENFAATVDTSRAAASQPTVS